MTLPNFLIIGTPRSGTTSLYEWLHQHPDIFLSPMKEPHFFGCSPEEKTAVRPPGMEFVCELPDYVSLFQGWEGQHAVGEASPCYLNRSLAPQHIKQIVPDVKMIAVFRNPIERAFSHYMLFRAQGIEREPDFLTAVRAERAGERAGTDHDWNYLGLGYYAHDLRRFQQHFAEGQIKTFLFEDLTKRTAQSLAEICEFLEIDSSFEFNTKTAYNASYVPRSETFGKVLCSEGAWKRWVRKIFSQKLATAVGRRLEDLNRIKPPKLTEEGREFLRAVYRADILELQPLIGRELSHWLEPETAKAGTKQAHRTPRTSPTLPARKRLSPQVSEPSDS